MKIEGKSLIGGEAIEAIGSGATFHAIEAATGAALEPEFYSASDADVQRAAQLAHEAFAVYKNVSGADKAAFLRAIAAGLRAQSEALVQRASQESALPVARLNGELARTTGQLEAFAALLEEGSWVAARIDHADPTRTPLPKPDLRSMLRPIGPVAVFGASNFPLAFSAAGGDTAAALAAGCPVIVKAHPAHPGAGEIAGRIVAQAARDCGLPAGVFALLFDAGHEVGTALVRHPLIKAVGFTGSQRGGRALMDIAAARPAPIPVYAEMGSINPLVILPGALAANAASLAAGLQGSVTLGVGQFCTNPGLVFLPSGAAGDALLADFAVRMQETAPGTMLTAGICAAYGAGVEKLTAAGARLKTRVAAGENLAGAAVFETDAAQLLSTPALLEEVFGPATLIVRYASGDDLRVALRALEGQLTATLHASAEELAENTDLVSILEEKAGRVLFGGFPTGVEVAPAMVHGGPYPATGDGRSTSVGTRAIERFTRAVCWQNFPDAALPQELQEANPLGIQRLVDGKN